MNFVVSSASFSVILAYFACASESNLAPARTKSRWIRSTKRSCSLVSCAWARSSYTCLIRLKRFGNVYTFKKEAQLINNQYHKIIKFFLKKPDYGVLPMGRQKPIRQLVIQELHSKSRGFQTMHWFDSTTCHYDRIWLLYFQRSERPWIRLFL